MIDWMHHLDSIGRHLSKPRVEPFAVFNAFGHPLALVMPFTTGGATNLWARAIARLLTRQPE